MTVVVTPDGMQALERKSWPLAGLESRYRAVDAPTGIPTVGLADTDYASLYRSQVWVFTVVNKISQAIARLPLKAYGTDPSGDRERLRSPNPLADLIKRPHPCCSTYGLIESACGSLAI